MAKARSALKELLFLVVVFAVLLGGLFAYTGVWPPAVIVESGSMMHSDNEVSYGRFGTIDPGDMVLVRKVNGADDIDTWADRGSRHYGNYGDVVIYYPGGNEMIAGRAVTPIIHRAMAWVTVTGSGDSVQYAVHWNSDVECPSGSRTVDGGTRCVFGKEGITIPEIGLVGCTTPCGQSGLITKGDNPVTNRQPDQISRISQGMVQADWIQGKARGEVPWLGLIKLALGPTPNENNPPSAWVKFGNAYAPKDLWVMLGVSLFVLIGLPVAYDAYKAIAARTGSRRQEDSDAPAAPEDAHPGDPGDDDDDAPAPDAAAPQGAEPQTDDTPAEAAAEAEPTKRPAPSGGSLQDEAS